MCLCSCKLYQSRIHSNCKNTCFIRRKEPKRQNVELIHLNDSKTKCNSCVDRHENLGKGFIGTDNLDGLIHFMSFSKKKGIPIILETPMNEYRKNDMDILHSA